MGRDKVLYEQIVTHRKRFYHIGGVDYAKDMPAEIDFIPQGELAILYRADYDNMLATYIYDRSSALSYDEIIQRMKQLRELFRKA